MNCSIFCKVHGWAFFGFCHLCAFRETSKWKHTVSFEEPVEEKALNCLNVTNMLTIIFQTCKTVHKIEKCSLELEKAYISSEKYNGSTCDFCRPEYWNILKNDVHAKKTFPDRMNFTFINHKLCHPLTFTTVMASDIDSFIPFLDQTNVSVWNRCAFWYFGGSFCDFRVTHMLNYRVGLETMRRALPTY